MQLAGLQQDIRRFEAEYQTRVGPYYVRLDELNAELWERRAAVEPLDEDLREAAHLYDPQRVKAATDAVVKSIQHYQEVMGTREGEAETPGKPKPTSPELESLRALRDELAKQAASAQWSHVEFLCRLIDGEAHERQERARQRRISLAQTARLRFVRPRHTATVVAT